MVLPPCVITCQFNVSPDYRLSCMVNQRSGDLFLGVPINIASYSLLTKMIAQVCGYKLGKYIHVIGDTHIYLNHVEQVKLQLTRQPNAMPQLKLNQEVKSIFDFTIEDFELKNYECHEEIKAQVAV
jgi:thymidylate synthase